MDWQDLAVFAIVLSAVVFLVFKLLPRERRASKKPDVPASRLVRKKKPG